GPLIYALFYALCRYENLVLYPINPRIQLPQSLSTLSCQVRPNGCPHPGRTAAKAPGQTFSLAAGKCSDASIQAVG
ncbi:MAG: hypothetical protein Q6M54_14690, partial [Thermostichus sp. DRC_bins_24]